VIVIVVVMAFTTMPIFDYDSEYDNDNEGTRSPNFTTPKPTSCLTYYCTITYR